MKHIIKSVYENNSSPVIRRVVAYFLDWYIISFLTILPINLIYSITYNKKNFQNTLSCLPTSQAFIAFVIGLLLTLLYLVYLPYKMNGQTIGKRLLKIRIINKKEYLDLKTLFIRNCIGLLVLEGTFFPCSIYFWELVALFTKIKITSIALNILTIISLLSLFCGLFLSQHRMLHDLISKTAIEYNTNNY